MKFNKIICHASQLPSSQTVFVVKSYYRVLQSKSHQSFPWNSLWNPKLPKGQIWENSNYRQPPEVEISCA